MISFREIDISIATLAKSTKYKNNNNPACHKKVA